MWADEFVLIQQKIDVTIHQQVRKYMTETGQPSI